MGIIKNNLANVLFSKVQQRILTLLYSKPDCDFHTNEIIRTVHSGTGAVQRELKKMTAAGLVIIKFVGNQKRYQVNSTAPFFAELRGLILKTFGLADILRAALKPLVDKQIYFAFIYGSMAKQEDTANSDIDLMIIGDKLTYIDLFKLLQKAEKQLGRSIHPTCYTPSEWLHKFKNDNHFINQIIKQPKIFLIGIEDDFKKLTENGIDKNRTF